MLLETIAQAIEQSGMTRYRISQELGIDESTLCRVVQGKGGISLATADSLCEFLGLVLVPKAKAKKRKGR